MSRRIIYLVVLTTRSAAGKFTEKGSTEEALLTALRVGSYNHRSGYVIVDGAPLVVTETTNDLSEKPNICSDYHHRIDVRELVAVSGHVVQREVDRVREKDGVEDDHHAFTEERLAHRDLTILAHIEDFYAGNHFPNGLAVNAVHDDRIKPSGRIRYQQPHDQEHLRCADAEDPQLEKTDRQEDQPVDHPGPKALSYGVVPIHADLRIERCLSAQAASAT